MKPLFLLKTIGLPAMAALLLVACKKNNSVADSAGSTGLDSSAPVAITGIGTPVGSPVSKSIGAAGGVLTSTDGVVVLTIPAGALTTATNITIQPVTSQMPDSLGLGYSLLPNGTKFNVPVTISFHYTSSQFANNNPEFSTIAYQDSSGAWVSDPINRDFDTTAKTVSLEVSHFTTFEMAEWLIVRSLPSELHAGKKATMFVAQSFWEKGTYPVIRFKTFDQLQSSQVESWQVEDIPGGSASVGTIVQNSNLSSATYYAPTSIPQRKVVFVKCVTKIHEVVYKKGKVYEDNPHLTAGQALTLLPDPEYNLTVKYFVIDSTIAPDFYNSPGVTPGTPVYTDSVQFDIDLKVSDGAWTSKCSNYRNGAPQVNPSQATRFGVTFTWTPDLTGELNVTSVVGRDGELATDSVVAFDVYNTGALLPGYLLKVNLNGQTQSVPITPYPAESGGLTYLEIDLKQIPYTDGWGAIGQYFRTVVSKKN